MELERTAPTQRTDAPLAYLVGPDLYNATHWRSRTAYALNARGIVTLHPKRANQGQSANQNGAFKDVKRCDVLLVNLLGSKTPSFDTSRELGWAWALQKPAVVAMERDGNPHDMHPMIVAAVPFRVATSYTRFPKGGVHAPAS